MNLSRNGSSFKNLGENDVGERPVKKDAFLGMNDSRAGFLVKVKL